MLKKYIVISLLAASLSASANNMSQDPKNTNLTIPTDISESRQRYEKPSRVSYAPKETEAPKIAEAKVADTTEIAEAEEIETPEPSTEPTKRDRKTIPKAAQALCAFKET